MVRSMNNTNTTERDFPAQGKITAIDGSVVKFAPAGTNYVLHLELTGKRAEQDVPMNTPVELRITVEARKIYSVPSGGNFVSPIFGPPKTIQGRVRHVSDNRVVVQAGTSFIVTLPQNNDAIDLNHGAIGVGSLINVVALPGARAELVAAPMEATR